MDEAGCPLCHPSRVVAADALAIAVPDGFPVTPGHTLVATRRHVSDWWAATEPERVAVMSMVDVVREGLDGGDPRPDGYNVGFNAGAAAGQTVPHLHVHVIPRWDGDVPDPRGGVRHVIPERGNYLAPPERRDTERHDHGQPPTSGSGYRVPSPHGLPMAAADGAGAVPTAEHSDTGFLRRVLALLEDGAKVATYKPALLMALVDLSAQAAAGRDPHEAVEIPVVDLADRVIELYWPQVQPQLARRYALQDGFHRLRQSSNDRIGTTAAGRRPNEARIPRAVAALCARSSALTSPLQARTRHPDSWDTARSDVAAALAKQPLPRLQRPGTARNDSFERFLYDDRSFGEHVSATTATRLVVRLEPGVARRLADAAPVLRPAIEVVWTRQVARINHLSVLEENLRDQLFGVTRTALAPVRDALLDAGTDECFWCGRQLSSTVHVDHVLPWAHYPIDSLYNLVLTDSHCNMDKIDRPVTARLLERWTDRDPVALDAIADDIGWPVARSRTLRLAVTAYTDVPLGFPLWDGRGTRLRLMTPAERDLALRALAS